MVLLITARTPFKGKKLCFHFSKKKDQNLMRQTSIIFIFIFAKKNNSTFIVLLKFKHCVILFFNMAKKIINRAAFDAAVPEK